MPDWRSAAAAALTVATTTTATAEPPDPTPADDLLRAVEMPAQRSLMQVIQGAGHEPSPFVSDGCSGGLTSSWRAVSAWFPGFAGTHQDRPPWEACCRVHDRAYHRAGGARSAEDGYAARLAADEAFHACVRATGTRRAPELSARYGLTEAQVLAVYDAIADAMFRAVRFGGAPCSGLPWRWGFGYLHCIASPHLYYVE